MKNFRIRIRNSNENLDYRIDIFTFLPCRLVTVWLGTGLLENQTFSHF